MLLLPRWCCLLLTLVPFAGVAAGLKPTDIKVFAELTPTGVQLASDVAISERPDGARIVEVKLTNRSDADVAIVSAEVTLPWPGEDAGSRRVASGAMASGRWPATLVFDPASDRAAPTSGMYLLAQTSGK